MNVDIVKFANEGAKEGHVKFSMEDHVLVATLNRPPHNFLSEGIIRPLADAIVAADDDSNVRAIVIQAEGKNFCSGADLVQEPEGVVREGEFIGANEGGFVDGLPLLFVHAARIYAAKKPIIAAVQGAALGGGLGLALLADFRVVSPEARFGSNFVNIGFHTGMAVSLILPRIIGQQKASLMILTGRRIKGEEALAWGMAEELVPLESLRASAMKLAQEIAANPPLAIAALRDTLRGRGELAKAVRERLLHETKEQGRLTKTEDFAEGVRAVAERRPGKFVGR